MPVGLTLMKAIAAKEEAGKAEGLLYPPVLPSREQLGDLLVAQKHAKQALAEYETDLKNAPNRFDGIYGAAKAAELSGNKHAAKKYFAELVKLGRNADADSPPLNQARSFLEGK